MRFVGSLPCRTCPLRRRESDATTLADGVAHNKPACTLADYGGRRNPRASHRVLKTAEAASIPRGTTTRSEPWRNATITQQTSCLVRAVPARLRQSGFLPTATEGPGRSAWLRGERRRRTPSWWRRVTFSSTSARRDRQHRSTANPNGSTATGSGANLAQPRRARATDARASVKASTTLPAPSR